MTTTGYARGRAIVWDGNDWRDLNGVLAPGYSGGSEWPCVKCGLIADVNDGVGGADPCLGILEDVISACCGHGIHKAFTMKESTK